MYNSSHPAPRFSIITVTYNAGKVLEETLRSVAGQTYRDLEYILVDGASEDDTLRIVDHYRSHIHTLISEPDKGLYDAMNKGIAAASGDYLCFLNAGDCFHADTTLEELARSLPAGRLPDILYGDTALVDVHRRFVRMRRLTPPETLTWKSFQQGMLVCHQAFYVCRALAEPYDLTYRFSADFDWCIRMMKKAHTLHHSHQILVDYLNEGMTTQNHRASLKERFRIMSAHYGLIATLCQHAWFIVRAVLKK